MGFSATSLPLAGCMVVHCRRHGDSRGYFMETWAEGAFRHLGIDSRFVQDNQSLSAEAGTVRGLHFQRPPSAQAKLVRVLAGAIFDVAVDLRQGSPTYGRWCGATLSAENGDQLFVPRGFAHGFCTIEPKTIVCYKVDAPYDPAADAGLIWDDPDIGVDWPVEAGRVVLSDKDSRLPFFREFVSPYVD